MCKEACGDGELATLERRGHSSSHQTVGAVGADDEVADVRACRSQNGHTIGGDGHIAHALGYQRGARASRRVEQRAVELAPARDTEGAGAIEEGRASATRTSCVEPFVNVASWTSTEGTETPTASRTSASARPVTPPPHGFSRGWLRSKMVTRAPERARQYAAHAPAGPAPTIETSVRRTLGTVEASVHTGKQRSPRPHAASTTIHTVHQVVLALFQQRRLAVEASQAVRSLGVRAAHLSIIARSHDEAGFLARQIGGTPGVEMEDSRPAALLGELGAHVLAAIALVMPGIGPIVAAGPLAAELGEVAGHVAGGIGPMLNKAGVGEERASEWEAAIERGAVLLGVHAVDVLAERLMAVLAENGADEIEVAAWPDDADDREQRDEEGEHGGG